MRHLIDIVDFSVEELSLSKIWKMTECTYDLHNDEIMNVGNIMTEYEEKFSSMGNPICKYVIHRQFFGAVQLHRYTEH